MSTTLGMAKSSTIKLSRKELLFLVVTSKRVSRDARTKEARELAKQLLSLLAPVMDIVDIVSGAEVTMTITADFPHAPTQKS